MRGLILILALVVFQSCGPTPVFSELQEVSSEGWTTMQPLTFDFSVDDVESKYELQLVIAHQTSYRYQNIYFNIITSFPDRPSKEEELSVDLAEKSGKWLGDCSTRECDTKVYLLENFKFPATGNYSFEISQYTRNENLKGVNSLELRLLKNEE